VPPGIETASTSSPQAVAMAVPGNCNLMSFLLAIMPCCVACVSLKRRKQLPQLPTVTVAGFEVPPPECSVHLSDTDKKKIHSTNHPGA